MARQLEERLELTEQVYFETPEQHARRSKLRRVVLGALGASVALLSVGVLLRFSAERAAVSEACQRNVQGGNASCRYFARL